LNSTIIVEENKILLIFPKENIQILKNYPKWRSIL